jgi:hypothetical protein
MIHFAIFGGQSGPISPDRKVYVTLFGGCELKRPTIARQLLEAKAGGIPLTETRFHYFITIFGGTEIRAPTLAEEYCDLHAALRSGQLSIDEWDRAVAQLGGSSATRYGSFTAFGGFEADKLPSEDDELDGIALSHHLGQMSEDTGRLLMLAIGQPSAQRPSAVRRALEADRDQAA